MSATDPRQAVCYHFQNYHDTALAIHSAIRESYDGPLDLALGFTAWIVIRDGIRTRIAVANEDGSRPTFAASLPLVWSP
jgi:ribonuclease Z